MKTFVPTLLTQEVFDTLEDNKNYVVLLVDDEPQNMVSKEWLARRIGAYKILLPKSLVIKLPDINAMFPIITGMSIDPADEFRREGANKYKAALLMEPVVDQTKG